jgi:hypothetical protein
MVDKSHVEPAHPMVIDLHQSLVAIYKVIREKYQPKIDATFDEISRQIGFVVTTTVPVQVEIGDGGKIKGTEVPGGLKGTLFEKIAGAVGSDSVGKVTAGKYPIYLIWYPALKLKLRTDFMEPAHLTPGVREPAHFAPGVREPAHWFDAGFAIGGEEAVLIHAIDEVYPELRLADRVSAARQASRALGPHTEPAHLATFGPGVREPAHFFGPGVREPAHFGPGVREPAHFGPGVREPAHLGPGIREPAHFPQFESQFAIELAALLKKFGF